MSVEGCAEETNNVSMKEINTAKKTATEKQEGFWLRGYLKYVYFWKQLRVQTRAQIVPGILQHV
jgi:hypothetical protein